MIRKFFEHTKTEKSVKTPAVKVEEFTAAGPEFIEVKTPKKAKKGGAVEKSKPERKGSETISNTINKKGIETYGIGINGKHPVLDQFKMYCLRKGVKIGSETVKALSYYMDHNGEKSDNEANTQNKQPAAGI